MILPDFLVIGAQKSGTTTLFSLLDKHPNIYLPPQKEVQFFSNDELYEKGVDWYSNTNFASRKAGDIVGEISPQYMVYKKVPQRIKKDVPEVKIIAILRHPLKRAFSQYQMSVRRRQESQSFVDSFNRSVKAYKNSDTLPEYQTYYQHSNYEEILDEYLAYFPKARFLLLFQEDLERSPEKVLGAIYDFLNVKNILPENLGVRLHQAGEIKYKWLEHLLKSQGLLRSFLKRILPWRIRAAITFRIEQYNIKKSNPQSLPDEILRDYNWVVREQKAFLKERFGLDAPWQEWQERTEQEILQNWKKPSEPIVSICCTTYNHENYIAEAINGFLIQETDYTFEIIICDKCSTDGTATIIKAYADRYPNIIKPIYEVENQYSKGVKPTSKVYKKASGKYLAICEGDNYWTDALKLQKQVSFLESNPEYVITYSDIQAFDSTGNIQKKYNGIKRDLEAIELNKCPSILALTTCFRNVLDELPPEAQCSGVSDLFLWSLLGNYGKGKFLEDIKPSRYRVHDGGIFSKKSAIIRLQMWHRTINALYAYYNRIGNQELATFFLERSLKESINIIGFYPLLKTVSKRLFKFK